MNRLSLIGIDPGIVDTGATCLRLDFERKTFRVRARAWTQVTSKNGWTIDVSHNFLDELAGFVQEEREEALVFVGIEGYRERGYNSSQDQKMIHLIQVINETLPGSVIIDNTGIKKIVTNSTMKLFGMERFEHGGNHADLKSAGRVALRLGISMDPVNTLLSDFMHDNLIGGRPWVHDSTLTL